MLVTYDYITSLQRQTQFAAHFPHTQARCARFASRTIALTLLALVQMVLFAYGQLWTTQTLRLVCAHAVAPFWLWKAIVVDTKHSLEYQSEC